MASSVLNKPTVVIRTVQSADTTLTINDAPTSSFYLIFFSVGETMGLYTTRAISTGSGTVRAVIPHDSVSSITLSNKTLTVNATTSSFKVVQIMAFAL